MTNLVQQRDPVPAAELVAEVLDPVALEARLVDARARRARALAGKTAGMPPMPPIRATDASRPRDRFLAGLAVGVATAAVAAALLQASVLPSLPPGPAPSVPYVVGRLEVGMAAGPLPSSPVTPVPVTVWSMPMLVPPPAEVAVRTDALWPASRARTGVSSALLAEASVPDADGRDAVAPRRSEPAASSSGLDVEPREQAHARLGAVDGPAPTLVSQPARSAARSTGVRPGAAVRKPSAPTQQNGAVAPRSGRASNRPTAAHPMQPDKPGRPVGSHGPAVAGKGPGGPSAAPGRGGHTASAGPSASGRGSPGGPGHGEARGGSGPGGGGGGRGHR